MNDFSTGEFKTAYLAESAEHLQLIHTSLLSLEERLSEGGASGIEIHQTAEVDQLFRSFHTLKGLSGMVGLDAAAQLSHAVESVLARVQKGQIVLSGQIIDQLLHATRTLEQLIQTIQDPESLAPDVSGQISEINQLSGERDVRGEIDLAEVAGELSLEQSIADAFAEIPQINAALAPPDLEKIYAAVKKDLTLLLGSYTPSAERAAQGQTIGRIQEQVLQFGEVLKTVPVVGESGVKFVLLVTADRMLGPQDIPFVEWTQIFTNAPSAMRKADAPYAAAAASKSWQAQAAISGATLVKVDLSRLDDLLYRTSDLVTLRAQFSGLLARLKGVDAKTQRELREMAAQMERAVRGLRQAVMRTRLVPLTEVFKHMPLAVRDMVRASGKEVRLMMQGEETEIDRMLVERLLDPLLHLVRNAITHGIETPAERVLQGKPPQGLLTIEGRPEGDRIIVSVTDDGWGIDRQKIQARAVQMGLASGERELSEGELLDLLTFPGFSTQAEADLGSGRGVGMDVVQRMAISIGGSLGMQSAPNVGTTFSLRLPLSLVIMDAILIRSGCEQFAVPQGMVDEIVVVDRVSIVRVEGGEILPYRGQSLALYRLSDLFGLGQDGDGKREPYGLIFANGNLRTALLVDQVLDWREIVVHPVADPLVARPGIAGLTESGAGAAILILDPAALIHSQKQKK